MAVRKRRTTAFIAATCIFIFLFWRLHESFFEEDGAHLSDNARHGLFTGGENHIANPLSSYIALPTDRKVLPRIQFDFEPETPAAAEARHARLQLVKEAMVHSWTGYRTRAWLKDELAPVSGNARSSFGSWGLTLIDSLDTLWLMGMKAEFEEAVEQVANIDFTITKQRPLSVFETTIRYLGGLLSAFDVSGGRYPILLVKANELGNMLYGAFDTYNHMPIAKWSRSGPGMEPPHPQTLIAELGTLSLEFTRLTQLTGDPRYYDAIQRVGDCIESQQNESRYPGLFPHTVNAKDCYFRDSVSFSINGGSDSAYEYFPKQYQLLGGAVEQGKSIYEIAREPLKQSILFRPMTPTNEDILLAGLVKVFRPGEEKPIPQTEHLACFAGGMFATAARLFDRPEDLETARRLVRGCIWAYKQTPTGIMPESFRAVPCPKDNPQCPWNATAWEQDMLEYNRIEKTPGEELLSTEARLEQNAQSLRLPQGMSQITSRGYYLRPEALESIFILYRVTGDESLREAAWDMFEAITRQTRTEYGYSCIEDVTVQDSKKTDRMESFWTAELLKYMWLLFQEPDVISLDEWVFNTEAHPFRLPTVQGV
jgi:mannosyl-oligosaccharide alpha-1,2-mannosidase